jgi:hypothetical protein
VRLHSAHLDSQDSFALGRQTLYDIFLETAKHHVFELIVQILDLALVVRVREFKLVSSERD